MDLLKKLDLIWFQIIEMHNGLDKVIGKDLSLNKKDSINKPNPITGEENLKDL